MGLVLLTMKILFIILFCFTFANSYSQNKIYYISKHNVLARIDNKVQINVSVNSLRVKDYPTFKIIIRNISTDTIFVLQYIYFQPSGPSLTHLTHLGIEHGGQFVSSEEHEIDLRIILPKMSIDYYLKLDQNYLKKYNLKEFNSYYSFAYIPSQTIILKNAHFATYKEAPVFDYVNNNLKLNSIVTEVSFKYTKGFGLFDFTR